jgi:4-cresol dehydrogenase (hydroxylating)
MTRAHPDLSAATSAFRAALGSAFVDDSPEALQRLERATFATSGRALLHLKPGSVDEVATCVRVAAEHGLVVNVFGRGRNYGYSSNAAVRGASVAIELSRLDAITELDDTLGVVRVQAGVTFAQLNEYLRARGARRFLPSTGGPADGSVLANTVERGHGLGIGGDRYEQSCRYEVVTPRGERLETGFGRFDGARIANLMSTGVGPSLDGLFTQSSLGIVTAATIWLPRRPRHWRTFLIATRDRERIGTLFAAIGEATRQGVVREGMAFAMNEHKLASLQLRREDFGPPGDEAVSYAMLKQHSRRWMDTAWLLACTVEADTEALVAAKARALGGVLRPVLGPAERSVVLSSSRARFALWLARFLSAPLAATIRQAVDVFFTRTPLLGHLIEAPLRTAYWAVPRDRPVVGDELHADRVGLLWVSVPVPLRADEVQHVCSRIDAALLARGFEPSTQVTLMSERLVRVITALMYERTTPERDQEAIDCARAAYAELARDGYVTYRLQPYLMDEYAAGDTPYGHVARAIKEALDPTGVLDPSRYPLLLNRSASPRGWTMPTEWE